MKSSRINVGKLVEKLKFLKPHDPDILKLHSVKAVICALQDIKNSPLGDYEGRIHANSSTGKNQPISESQQTFHPGSDIGAKSTSHKNTRYIVKNSDSGSVTTEYVTSSDIPTDKAVSEKKSFATLIHNFENMYKSVAKKYFFMLKPRKPSKSNFFGVFFSILAFIFYFELHTITGFSRLWLKWENVELRSVECTIESPNLAMELFRPPVSCAICHNVKSVDRVSGISPAEFERLYAYTGRPVIVSNNNNRSRYKID
ncbi:hypothetical protein Ocin01_12024 [Orchesella cincta]|uniref:Uncharacterized protein n=1 Tax=Orchesella cincta TaxID=48709 RepID=A0A1D2MP70_ORCCI|nr:hypothetical protein Ocin01_12024 [Orchesella cincta]